MADLYKLGLELVKPLAEKNESIYNMFFGKSGRYSETVFAARIKQGISQNKLAELMGVEKEVVYRLEGGSIDMGDEIYNNAFSVLGMDYLDYKE
jgi:DNA-binding XRE family transcriptional regulator